MKGDLTKASKAVALNKRNFRWQKGFRLYLKPFRVHNNENEMPSVYGIWFHQIGCAGDSTEMVAAKMNSGNGIHWLRVEREMNENEREKSVSTTLSSHDLKFNERAVQLSAHSRRNPIRIGG